MSSGPHSDRADRLERLRHELFGARAQIVGQRDRIQASWNGPWADVRLDDLEHADHERLGRAIEHLREAARELEEVTRCAR